MTPKIRTLVEIITLAILIFITGAYYFKRNHLPTVVSFLDSSRVTLDLVKGQSGQAGDLTLTLVSEVSVAPPVQSSQSNAPEILPETEYHLKATDNSNSQNFTLRSSNPVYVFGSYRIRLAEESQDHNRITVEIDRAERVTVPAKNL